MSTRRSSVILGVALVALVFPKGGAAGTIRMSVDVRAVSHAGGVSALLVVSNSGDEAARAVVSAVRLVDHAIATPVRGSLGPGEHLEARVDVPWDTRGPGDWPLIVTTDYADGNGYPFQALQVSIVSRPGATPALLAVTDVEADPVVSQSDVRVRLKSLAPVPREVRLRILVPQGLEADPPLIPVTFEPWGDRQLGASLFNRAALAGSRLPVFAVAEYDDGDGHHTALAHDLVEVRARTVLKGRFWLAVAAVLVVVWGAAVLVRGRLRARRRSSATAPPPGEGPRPAS